MHHEGMTLRERGRGGPQALDQALAEAGPAQAAALYEFAQGLLGCAELVPDTLNRMYRLVPAAQRLAVVAWPPGPDGVLRHLVPPEPLLRKGVAAGSISRTLARLAVESGQALLFSDAEGDLSDSLVRHGIRSAVYAPLADGEGRVLGVLCVDTPVPSRPFSRRDFHLVQAVAGLLSAALGAAERRGREVRRETLQSCLRRAGDDLRSPLEVIRSCASTLRGLGDGPVRDLSRLILDSERRAEDLVQSWLLASDLEEGREVAVTLREVDVPELIGQEIEFHSRALAGRPRAPALFGRVEVARVQADPGKLRQMVGHLIAQALRHCPDDGKVIVNVRPGEGEVHFRVTGPLPEDLEADRPGAPLWLAAALARAHGGRLGAERDPGGGSTIYFTLPRDPRDSGGGQLA